MLYEIVTINAIIKHIYLILHYKELLFVEETSPENV